MMTCQLLASNLLSLVLVVFGVLNWRFKESRALPKLKRVILKAYCIIQVMKIFVLVLQCIVKLLGFSMTLKRVALRLCLMLFGQDMILLPLNRQGNDVGTQYRSGIYYYTPEQEKAAKESMEQQQKLSNRKIVTEILPAKKFYRAEEYHQQYLAKGGRFGFKQSTEKGCNDPIRCYG
ncbi:PEPTIDE METHIONINE SULFOXIDE REDUCTASE A4 CHLOROPLASTIC [Salix purpurea]|uniref:peptide-methionine (S)-S-oxide reductase n=1 Tax=Salix purpurea TaxID=77065 RepID=A0A9Q0VGE8_SALPP|nr:PEPTIDE METHIONINE SULFOXIDE REDUCTASE A4 CHLOROPLASTIC [Salix purpurea]